jgi:hypothetical protein
LRGAGGVGGVDFPPNIYTFTFSMNTLGGSLPLLPLLHLFYFFFYFLSKIILNNNDNNNNNKNNLNITYKNNSNLKKCFKVTSKFENE